MSRRPHTHPVDRDHRIMDKAVDLLEDYMLLYPPRKKALDTVVEKVCKSNPCDVDVLYRAEVARNPVNSEVWLGWIDQRSDKSWCLFAFYELALTHIPRSYKVWHRYLTLVSDSAKALPSLDDKEFDRVNALFDRALVNLFNMPRIWIMYGEFLLHQKKVTKTRAVLDQALRLLPITLHQRIWEVYIGFLKMIGDSLPALSVSIWSRYLKLQPHHREIYVEFLLASKRYDDAALALADMVNEETFISLEGKSRNQVWMQLCQLVSEHAQDIHSIQVEHVLRGSIKQFGDDSGRVWNWLANYYIVLGEHERARDIFEEALEAVTTVKDFSLVFAAYVEFEETSVEFISTTLEEKRVTLSEDQLKKFEERTNFHLSRYENLLERRPEILSRVKLRMNPNNCYEWLNRAKLFDRMGKEDKVLTTFAEATKTIDPNNMIGSLAKVWIKFAEYYEKHGEVDNARNVLIRAVDAPLNKMDDIASLWCELVELELRHGQPDKALVRIRSVIHRPKVVDADNPKSLHNQVWRSQKLWSLALDMEEVYGTLDALKACFDVMCDLKIVTTQQLLNYAQALESKHYFEAAFTVYETGVALFTWPQLYHIWLVYLSKFCSRYEGKKLERSRELFERAINQVPPKHAKRLFIMYMNMEEEYGLSRQALDVLVRSIDKVHEGEKWAMYKLLIAKTIKLFGILKTRPIFEKCLRDLSSEDERREACLMFSKVERGLGEINRARAIFNHGSQFANPNEHLAYWTEWREFEVMHGNEESFREMLRTKRVRM
eukprot:GHVH01005764.1.p1 GENE.GHVH01005764.1~~GHVH01005764.1.p1  ORF type:complete len:774 (-),score=105.35 GHVH01005764.1:1154-3475(-)